MEDIFDVMNMACESVEVNEKIRELLSNKPIHLQTVILGATLFEILMELDKDSRMKECCDLVTTLLELTMKRC